MKDEITAGLRNGIDRGEKLEEAMQSLVNAGYNPMEVRQAAASLTQGATSVMGATHANLPKPDQDNSEPPQNFSPAEQPPSSNGTPQDKQSKKKIILIILLAILLLIVVGGVIALIFLRDKLPFL
jgi:hypothetical protein